MILAHLERLVLCVAHTQGCRQLKAGEVKEAKMGFGKVLRRGVRAMRLFGRGVFGGDGVSP